MKALAKDKVAGRAMACLLALLPPLMGCGEDRTVADDPLVGTYVVNLSAAGYGRASLWPEAGDRDCAFPTSDTAAGEMEVEIWKPGRRYRVEVPGGCEVNVELQGNVLVGDGEACDLDPDGGIALWGTTEILHDVLRLDLEARTFVARTRSKRMVVDITLGEDGSTTSEPYELTGCGTSYGTLRKPEETAPSPAVTFHDASFRVTHLSRDPEVCGSSYFSSDYATGSFVSVDEGYLWQAYACVIDPEALPVTCQGGNVFEYELPDLVVEEFATEPHIYVAGRFVSGDGNRCFTIDASPPETPVSQGAGGAGGAGP